MASSWTISAPGSDPSDPTAGDAHGETCDALVAEYLRAGGHHRTLRALEVATSGRCSGKNLHRLQTVDGALERHEEDNAFGSKLEAMASYSSKYEDGRSGGGRRERHAASSSRRGAEWTEDDLARLKRAAAKYAGLEKNERWRKVGHKLGRSKRECYDRYKQLKEDVKQLQAYTSK